MSSEQKTSTAPSREAKAERSQSAKAERALTDRQLVEKCLKGDQQQWEKLYHQCQPRLRNAIEILLGLNSPDKYLVDEISARVWHALLRDECRLLALYDPQRDSTLDAFLMGLARIEIMRHNRAERRRQSHELIRGRRKLEEQILQTQKLESLAILTGGIAHDFNNLLTGILGHADLVRRDLAADAPGHENLHHIVTAAKRAAALTKQMLVYSGRERSLFEEVDLTGVIAQAVGGLQERAGHSIRVTWHQEGENLRLRGDTGQLGQILKTLVTNATEAFNGGGGTVRVSTGFRQCGSAYLAEAHLGGSLTPGRYVFLEVSDDGCGMDEATRAKVFDPFFTTKFAGRGLGLAAVLGIVRSHRGAVKVASHPDDGTTVTVLLPPAA